MSREVVMKNLGKIFRPAKQGKIVNLPRIGGPSNTENVIAMAGVGTMQYKRCKLSHEVVRCPPDIEVRVGIDGDIPDWLSTQALRKEVQYKLSIRRKSDGLDWSLKVEMVQDHRSLKIHQQSSTVCNTCQRHGM
jgi:hypothetical protein